VLSDCKSHGSIWACAILAIGFSIGVTSCSNGSSGSPTALIAGTVEGGLNPIIRASVSLYQAGTQGYGIGATLLGRATTNSHGNFSIIYSPPAKPALLYLVAVGGNEGLGNNPATGLIGIAGMSNALPHSIMINELTTVAAEWALAQFTDWTGQIIGTSPGNIIGLRNAVLLQQTNLVDITTGLPSSFWPTATQCTGTVPPSNCAGLERLNALADILAACVDSSGPSSSACSTLLGNTDNGGTTLQASHTLATNPTLDAKTLYTLAQQGEPFSPVPAQAPNAWFIALKYVGNGHEFDGPGNMAFDQNGNIWSTNNYLFNSDPAIPTCGGKEVIELTPVGEDALGAPYSGGGVDGAGFGIAIDPNHNVWVSNFGFSGKGCANPPPGNSLSEFDATGSALSPSRGFTAGTFDAPQGIAIDPRGDVWVANFRGDSITEYLNGDPAAALHFSNLGLNLPFDLAIDASGNLWISNTGNNTIVELDANGSVHAGSPFSGGGLSHPLGIAIDELGNVWIANSTGDSVTMLHSTGAPATGSPYTGGGIRFPWGIAVDGNTNVWVANFTGIHGRLSELCGAVTYNCPIGFETGQPITPPTGYASSLLMRNTGIAIDASGDVWVANNWKPFPVQTNPGGDSLVEFIGLAGPVQMPMLGPVRKP